MNLISFIPYNYKTISFKLINHVLIFNALKHSTYYFNKQLNEVCDFNIKINYIQRTRLFTNNNNNKQNMLIIFLSNFPLKIFKEKNLHLKWNVEQIYNNSNIITMKIPCINNGIMCNKYTPSSYDKCWKYRPTLDFCSKSFCFIPNSFCIWFWFMEYLWFETMLINCFHRLIYHIFTG